MKSGTLFVVAAAVALSTNVLFSASPKAQEQSNKVTASGTPVETTGDDIFRANCSRCHMPPMSISPRTTGTIIMHMRTRARLSREDEVKLLKFMAP
jgi:cytochrome c5